MTWQTVKTAQPKLPTPQPVKTFGAWDQKDLARMWAAMARSEGHSKSAPDHPGKADPRNCGKGRWKRSAELRWNMLEAIREGCATRSALARRLGIATSTTNDHIRRLRRAGEIRQVAKRGNEFVYEVA